MYRVRDHGGSDLTVETLCDFCGMPITGIDPGGPVVPRVLRLGKTYTVRNGHAGSCQDALEERLAKENRDSSMPGDDIGG